MMFNFFISRNFGHVVAKCRSRMIQANNSHIERSSTSKYFKGYCFSCNMFRHKSIDFYRGNMKHVRFYACNKFGHIVKEYKRKFRQIYQKKKTSSHYKVWKKKEVQSEMWNSSVYRQNRIMRKLKHEISVL